MINSLFGDRYKLGEMIGTGGMADVYVAEDTLDLRPLKHLSMLLI